jgi:hypothetical protein
MCLDKTIKQVELYTTTFEGFEGEQKLSPRFDLFLMR